jgi:hypothetical protein
MPRCRPGWCFVITGSTALSISATVDAGIVIDSWYLETGVLWTGGTNSIASTTVQNPFQSVQDATGPGPTTGHTEYSFGCSASAGDFLIEGSHHVPGIDPQISLAESGGGIYLTPDADLLLAVDAAYTYNLAGPNMFVQLIFEVDPYSSEPADPVFSAVRRDDTVISFPASGTLSIHGQASVPAGQTYIISYSHLLRADGITGATADGSGYIHWTLTEVPAPATLGPLAFAALVLRRPRRDRAR